jgi:hypothetical protein
MTITEDKIQKRFRTEKRNINAYTYLTCQCITILIIVYHNMPNIFVQLTIKFLVP